MAVDHRGWGRSSAPGAGYAIEDLAGDALAVIDALRVTDYILVGHSMGGNAAQLLASRQDRVEPTEVMKSHVLAKIPGELSDRIAGFRDAAVRAGSTAQGEHTPLHY